MSKQLSHWPTVLDIIRAAMERDADKARSYATLLAARIEVDGDQQLAERIRRVVGPTMGARQSSGSVDTFNSTQVVFSPIDPESRSPFVDEASEPYDDSPILDDAARAEITRFIEFQTHEDAFLRAGFTAPRSMLLYGPPGCGKNTTASHVAGQLRLPLLTARLDAIVSSYLGTTAKNLRNVFEHASRRAGVLFLDEFDALAKMRDDANEIGELKRIVNSLIQNMDAYPQLFIIAATNHEHLLDSAVWRRFDVAIKLSLPAMPQRAQLLQKFLAPLELDSEIIDTLAEITDGWSGADLRRICVRSRQDLVLDSGQSLAQLLTHEIWLKDHPQQPDHSNASSGDSLEKQLTAFVNERTQGKAPSRVVSQLVGISLWKAARLKRN